MTTLENAARMALEALQLCANGTDDAMLTRDALASLRQALEQPKQKPVAWWNPRKDTVSCDPVHRHHFDCTPLYTEPPQREWVGLTDEELVAAYMSVGDKEWAIAGMEDANKFAQVIEATLKAKNT